MGRNASGTYSLPQAAFVQGTTIASAAMNSNLSDIATALTQSLSTTGVSSMTGVIKAVDGSLSAPGYTFASELSTGMWRGGPGQIKLSVLGTQTVAFNSDTSVTWAGAATWGGTVTFNGTTAINSSTVTFGAGAATAFWTGMQSSVGFEFVIDGLGAVISTGNKGHLQIPFPSTIAAWRVMADQSGSIVIDILRANNGVPTVSIVGGGTAPNLSALQFAEAVPGGWTSTSLVANDYIAFNVTSASSVTRVTVVLSCIRTGP